MAPAHQVQMRSLESGDRPRVAALDEQHTGQAKPEYWRRLFGRIDHADGVLAIGATLEAQIIGYLIGEVRAFEFGSEPCGWIFAIGVDPSRARLGIGRKLLDEVHRRFRGEGVSRVRTMVQRTDIPLLTFFRSHEFVGGPFVQLERDIEESKE